MKQTIKTTKTITMGLFTLCTIGLTNPTFANPKTGDPIEFKYIGKIKNQPVFQLNLNNDASEVYYITLKDGSNNVIYSEKVKAKDVNYTRKYQLDINEEELNASEFGVKVEVTSLKTHETQVYKISSQTNVHEDIIVAKL
jgi:hypothetical protein